MTSPSSFTRRDLALGATGLPLIGLAASADAAAPAVPAGGRARASVPAEDRLDMIELMARYAWAYDTGMADALAATFTPDGVLEVFGKTLATGRTGFAAFLATAAKMRGDSGWQHLSDHHVFRDYDGERCRIYSYYLMPESDAAGGNVHLRAMGYYVSHCVRTGAGWLFEKREVARWNGRQPF